MTSRHKRMIVTTDLVAIILSVSMGIAINLLIISAILEAYANPITLPIGLGDNATQVLTGWGGGIIGVIGALVGLRLGRRATPPPEPIPVDERVDV